MKEKEKVHYDCNLHEVFGIVVARMTEALMLHDDMSNMYDFLNLRGYKRVHETQFFKEAVSRKKFIRFVLNHYSFIPKKNEVKRINIIPHDWYNYERKDVSTQIRKQAVEHSFGQYMEWERESKEIYEACAKRLYELGELDAYCYMLEIVKCVGNELKELERMLLSLKSVSFDILYIESEQEKIHDKYREELNNIEMI